jgi:hypothetical protein
MSSRLAAVLRTAAKRDSIEWNIFPLTEYHSKGVPFKASQIRTKALPTFGTPKLLSLHSSWPRIGAAAVAALLDSFRHSRPGEGVIQVKEILQQHLRRLYSDEHRPKNVLVEARAFIAQGKYDAALEKYLWFHRHALEHNEALAGVRLSFALDEWVKLGEVYPPARDALLSVRDDAVKAFADGNGSFTLFMDVAAINGYLHDDARTVQLFKRMHQGQPELAWQCYAVAEPTLVESGEYATCVSYLPDLEEKLEAILQSYRMTLEIAEENLFLSAPEAGLKGFAKLKLAEETGRLIAILEGVGRLQDAERVREFVRDRERE